MPMVATGSGAIDVMSKLLQDRILMLNGQVPWDWLGKEWAAGVVEYGQIPAGLSREWQL